MIADGENPLQLVARPPAASDVVVVQAGAAQVAGLGPFTEVPAATRLGSRPVRATAGQNKRRTEFESSQLPSQRARQAAGASGSDGGAAGALAAGSDGAMDVAVHQAAAEQRRVAAEQAAATEQQRVTEAVGEYCLRSEQDVLARYPDFLLRLPTCTDIAVLRLLCTNLYSDLETAEVRTKALEAGLAQVAEMSVAHLAVAETCATHQHQLAHHAQRLATRVEQVCSGAAVPTDPGVDEPADSGCMTIEMVRLQGLGLLGRTTQVFVLKLTKEGDGSMQLEPYVMEREVVSIYSPPSNTAATIIAGMQQKVCDLECSWPVACDAHGIAV